MKHELIDGNICLTDPISGLFAIKNNGKYQYGTLNVNNGIIDFIPTDGTPTIEIGTVDEYGLGQVTTELYWVTDGE